MSTRATQHDQARPPLPAPGVTRHATTLRIPRATYRLQLHKDFGLAAVTELVPYLAELGVSHLYCSPYLEARPGSTHGYDVIAHDRLNPELGTMEDYDRLCDALAANGMGHILDMVPNHVGVGPNNDWWQDVLEHGRASAHADHFDIDWEPLKAELRGKVLLPVLGDYYGKVLEAGELRLEYADGGFRVSYYDHSFPIDPREYPRILGPDLSGLRASLGEESLHLAAFESLLTAFAKLPERGARSETALTERRRDSVLHKARLGELSAQVPAIRTHIAACIERFQARASDSGAMDRLHTLLEAQAYRLAHWRVASDEINYRRFFDINDLAALRMENPRTFEATHRLVLDLIAAGRIDGLRIDHPDGLHDPAGYFQSLQEAVDARRDGADEPARADDALPLYLLVEKILVGEEQLRDEWQVHGTTGYEFAALADGLMVDSAGAEPLERCYRDFTGGGRPLREEIYRAKRLVMQNLLSSELHLLASELSRIAESDLRTRDYTLDALRATLMEIVACFPVYRTYITAAGVSTQDRNQILKAVSEARRRSDAPDLSVFDFVRDVLLTEIAAGKSPATRKRVLRLAMKVQQYTGPVTAKGIEDTAFYRYHRLVSLNDVGGEPDEPGISVERFHRANQRRLEHWPHNLLAGSTHDSKRAEDVRSRLHLLSELPELWRQQVERWSLLNRRLRRTADGKTLPDANTEYLLYQTLLGAWPLADLDAEGLADFRGRIQAYMEKASNEAKVHTTWTNQNPAYREGLAAFVDAVLDPQRNAAFFDAFLPFKRRIARLGLYNSLSTTLLRMTSPGVPDIYQGTELWSFSLVDPDNRRPVDFSLRRRLLAGLPSVDAGDVRPPADLGDLVANLEDGRAKLHLVHRLLLLRQAHPRVFARGTYEPLSATGVHADRLCAFARSDGETRVIVVAPRLFARLAAIEKDDGTVMPRDPFADAGWDETYLELADGTLADWIGGAAVAAMASDGLPRIALAPLLRSFPVVAIVGPAPR